MNIFNAIILSNEAVADKIFRLIVNAPELSKTARAGQFVQVKIADEFTLRRPLGIAGTSDGKVKIFYRAVGHGTDILSKKRVGEYLNILGALGNGFSTLNGKILLVGGGMGLAPLLCAAEKAIRNADVLIGGRNSNEVNFWIDEFRPLVKNIFITTDDGSISKKGFVTDLLPDIPRDYSAIYTCGPEVMMKGVAKFAMDNNLPCEVSFEKRMACGLGACLSCSIDTADGRRKVCKDGPVFDAKKVFGGDLA